MNTTLSLSLTAAACALGAWAWMTGPEGNSTVAAAAPANSTLGAERAQRTQARLESRSMARWSAVCRGDWIAAYDFQTTEQKLIPLAQYLQGKSHHTYANPAIERVVGLDLDDGFLEVRVVWTPTHPELRRVRLEPGQSLTEEIRMIESWRWDGEDWCYVRAQRIDEFYKEHPELQPR